MGAGPAALFRWESINRRQQRKGTDQPFLEPETIQVREIERLWMAFIPGELTSSPIPNATGILHPGQSPWAAQQEE